MANGEPVDHIVRALTRVDLGNPMVRCPGLIEGEGVQGW